MRIFLDTEFTDFLDPRLISLGLVTEDGLYEFYGEVLIHDWMGHESDFVRAVVVPLLNGPATSIEELRTKVIAWFSSLPYAETQAIIDTQTDWALLAEECLEGYGPAKLVTTPTFIHVELAVEAQVHASKFGMSSQEKVRRNFDADRTYHQEQTRYFSDTKQKQHHALTDARAMRHGFLAALVEIGRGLYRPLQL